MYQIHLTDQIVQIDQINLLKVQPIFLITTFQVDTLGKNTDHIYLPNNLKLDLLFLLNLNSNRKECQEVGTIIGKNKTLITNMKEIIKTTSLNYLLEIQLPLRILEIRHSLGNLKEM